MKIRKSYFVLPSLTLTIKNCRYALAVVTYALHLADSTKKEDALKMLEELKVVDSGLPFIFINTIYSTSNV
jgi:hypothetical protein